MAVLQRTRSTIDRDLAAGQALGAQVFVSRDGETIIDEAFGEAAPGVALTSDMLLPWMSCSKPITAIAIAQQWEESRLDLDVPIVRYIPEFAQGGKDEVTIRQLLTHTAGFRKAGYRFPHDAWDTIIARVCAAPLEEGWIVGETAGYDPGASWFILGELVRRASGEALCDYVRRHIFDRIGMGDCYLGMPPEVYDEVVGQIAPMWDTHTHHEPRQTVYTKRSRLTACSPGGGAVGPARQLGRFYQALLDGGDELVDRETVELFTARHREGKKDLGFKQIIDWGLGFIRDSKRYGKLVIPYGFGAHASDETFGHGGNQSSLSFADPGCRLVVAFIFNGMPGERAHQQRSHDVATAIYEDLGLNRG